MRKKKRLIAILIGLLLSLIPLAILFKNKWEAPSPVIITPIHLKEDPNGLPALARRQIGVTVGYTADYVDLEYPGGDVPMESGVCTDVIIRALRLKGLDLQELLHEDIKHNFRRYPGRKLWRQRAADPSIDHRRVPNLEIFFNRIGWSVTEHPTDNPDDYKPGDLVTCFDAAHGRPHIMIVSDRKHEQTGVPKVIHNSGKGTEENDDLFEFPITGHFRPVFGKPIQYPEPEKKKKK
ncbi:MAG: DUF1287 domain-containing protein [Akkermansiaceae bacterium]|nr:DUF1287 domain-containing protein [Akkermansiaceae bacterium]